MVRTLSLSLRPTSEQKAVLLATIEAFNAACSYVSAYAWKEREFNSYRLRKATYREVRETFGLPARLAQHAIAKVANAYKGSKAVKAEFRRHGAVTYDRRVFRLIEVSGVSMTLVSGREKIQLSPGGYHADRLRDAQIGEVDLCYLPEKQRVRLHLSLKRPTPEEQEPEGVLGVDLGIVNLAVTSDGEVFSSQAVRGLRRRHLRLRTRLQKTGTKSAYRRLKQRRRKERRFATHVNHCVSKKIVAVAKGTGRAIALEELKGIRRRITVRRAQRATFSAWSFAQLGEFVRYKAETAGVALIQVDPRNTSRTCPACGCIDKANRKDQRSFSCVACRHSGLADQIAATNIAFRGRAALTQPYVSKLGTNPPLKRRGSVKSLPPI
jgi:putative transposase